jgi:carboxybiotin decarboxylase
MVQALTELIRTSGIANTTYKEVIMIAIACLFLYLAIKKEYEPYLLIPIAFGILLVNLPLAGLMNAPADGQPGGLLYYLYQGTNLGIYPPLIFLCLGAATDFGPLIANPKTLLLGGAAQFGIFAAFFGALALGMTPQESASVGIIGGADGPTAIYLTSKLANHLLPVIALAAYSYMALVPIIQPPIMRLLTTEKERQTEMKQMRVVNKAERVLFPIVTTIFISLVVPSATSLISMLMLGNLVRESGQVPKLSDTLQTAAGVLMGKLMYKLTNGKINPLIGAAGVSAVPMAARVVQKVGIKSNPSNYLLMHAMGPNVAGVIGSAVAAGVLLAFFG